MQLSRKFVVRSTDDNLVFVYAHLFFMRILYQTSRLSPITNAVFSAAKAPRGNGRVELGSDSVSRVNVN